MPKKILINRRYELLVPEFRANALPWSSWEKERINAMRYSIRKGDYVIDIGAELGDLSALYSRWCGGNIILVEPSANYWPHIKSIFSMNDLEAPLASFVGFASEVETDHRLYVGYPPEAEGELTLEGDEGFGFRHLNEQSDAIPQTTIDSISSMYPVNVINIDVEGAEYRTILGATKTIEKYKPLIFVSVHPTFMYERYRNTQDDLIFHLEKFGYDHQVLGIDHEIHMCFYQ